MLLITRELPMTTKEQIYQAATQIRQCTPHILDEIAHDPVYLERHGKLYPYDTLSANLDPIFALLEGAGEDELLSSLSPKYIADIGCANGDLSFVLAMCGYRVISVDFSFGHDQAPFVVSRVADALGLPIAVVDQSIDTEFRISDFVQNCIYDRQRILSNGLTIIPLCICVGLLYHLRNPFAFLRSLASISNYSILGTHIFAQITEDGDDLSDLPLAYLVDDRELNNDPTNFWIFTKKSIERILDRAGFQIMSSHFVSNNSRGLALPYRSDLGTRGFYLAKSKIRS